MDWRSIFFPQDQEAVYEFPRNCGSTFRFKVRRSPVFGEIGLPNGGPTIKMPAKLQSLIKYSGILLDEPELVFSNKAGTGRPAHRIPYAALSRTGLSIIR
jgi:hypothetical protein